MNKLPLRSTRSRASVSGVPIVIDEIDVTTDHGRQAVAKLRGLQQVPGIKVQVLSVGKRAAPAANLAPTDGLSGRSS